MDFLGFYTLVLRNFIVIAISTALGLLGGALVTALMTPMYQSQVQLFVSTPSQSLDLSALTQGSSFSQQRVKSYSQIINGASTLVPVINELRLDDSYDELAKRVKASAPLDTVLINITVTDESPVLAARIANAIGREFAQTVNSLETVQAGSETSIKVSIVKEGRIPDEPSSPRPLLNLLLGFILGLGAGIGIGLLRQIFDRTVKSENDLGDVQLLAAVGFDESANDKPLITQISKYHARTEAIRTLRTNVQFLKTDTPSKVLAFTSATPGEGKSSTSLNLAISFIQAGLKVVLVEADLRRPKLAKYLQIESKAAGLAEFLLRADSDSTQYSEFLSKIAIEGLSDEFIFMPSGEIPPNPAELLNSSRFEKLIQDLRRDFDYVLIDCPPALPVTDASIISTYSDGVIVVVKTGETQLNQFLGVKDSIENVGSRVIGAVLNMIPRTRTYVDYGYRYGYGYGRGYYKYSRNYAPYGKKSGYDPENAYGPESKQIRKN